MNARPHTPTLEGERDLVGSPSGTWRRRAVTIPLAFALSLALVALSPAWLLLGFLIDTASRGRLAVNRGILFMTLLALCESAGVIAATCFYLARPFVRKDPGRFVDWNFRLQGVWTSTLLEGARILFRLKIVVDDSTDVSGPVLVFARHASVADTLFPSVFLSGRKCVGKTPLRLKYVLKEELLWDPCLDIVGQRLENAFVSRGQGASAEIAKVAGLTRDLDDDQGVLIFPEGTRFTEKKRARVLERLESGGNKARLDEALALTVTLPPRHGGPLALLNAAPAADVLLLKHTGFEGIETIAHLVDGTLLDRTIEIAFERIPRQEIPDGEDAQRAWLFETWTRVDAWVRYHQRNADA